MALAAMTTEDRKKLGLNGRNYAEQEFGRAELMDRLDALLYEAVNNGKAKT
jgi:hypothetical protein